MASACRIVVAVLVIVIAVLQFTKIFETSTGRCTVLGLAGAAVVATILAEIFTCRENRARDFRFEATLKRIEAVTDGSGTVKAESEQTVVAPSAKDDVQISAKYVTEHLVNRHPFAAIVGDLYRAMGRESPPLECDLLVEIHLVNKTDTPVTIQSIIAEAELSGSWVPITLNEDLRDYQIEYEDELVDNPGWIGGQHPKREDLSPNLALELKGAPLVKGIGHRGWLRFGIDIPVQQQGKPIQHRITLVDALDNRHGVAVVGPMESRGRMIHNPEVWSQRLRSG